MRPRGGSLCDRGAAAALLGALLVSRIGLAGLSRTDIPEDERRDFHVYLDEFQNFTTLSLANMLSELRKYRVNLVLAHQYLSQLDEDVSDAILGNGDTIISMKTTFKLVYPRHNDVSEMLSLLDRVKKSNLRIDVKHEIIRDTQHANTIKEALLRVSVLGKIQIRQTKSGLLYSHLLVYRGNTLSTFYPQRRKGEPETTMEEFLKAVLTQNQRQNLVASFYETGKECIESAKFLYHGRKARSRYEILLTQGIES